MHLFSEFYADGLISKQNVVRYSVYLKDPHGDTRVYPGPSFRMRQL